MLIKVDTITVPAAPDKAEADKLTTEISQQLSEDLASQYMASLQSRYGVKINQDALNRAAGRSETNASLHPRTSSKRTEIMAGAYHESAAVFEPGPEAFAKVFSQGKAQVVWTRLVADLETPVSAYMKLAQHDAGKAGTDKIQPMSFLLESVEGGINRGRYSMIGIAPDVVFRAQGERAEVNRNALTKPDGFVPMPGKTLEALRALLAESAIALPEQLPPMAVGVFGYMGYDTVRLVEHLPKTPPDALGVPDALLMRPTVMVIFDAIKVEMIIVTPVYPASTASKKSTAGKDDKVGC